MKQGLQQHGVLRQDLRINPRLYQAMDLLYMPLLDLQQHLKEELLGNPFLEMVEPEEQAEISVSEEAKTEKEERQAEDEPDWERILLDDQSETGMPRASSDVREYIEPVPVERPNLSDHLQEQVRMLG
jgi:RNA polymerase sigma-54 factor